MEPKMLIERAAAMVAPELVQEPAFLLWLDEFLTLWPNETSREAAWNHAAARSHGRRYDTLNAAAAARFDMIIAIYGKLRAEQDAITGAAAPAAPAPAIDLEDTVLAPTIGPLDPVSFAPPAEPVEAPAEPAAPVADDVKPKRKP